MLNRIYKKVTEGLSLAIELSSNPLYGLWFYLVYLVTPILKLMSPKPISIKVPVFYNKKLSYVYITSSTDFAVMREVFLDKEYEVPTLENPEIIIDMGANTGISVLYWKHMYPKSIIHAYEPDPDTFQKLKKNTNHLSDIHLYNEGISGHGGSLQFYVHPDSNISSSFTKRSVLDRAINVPTVTLTEAVHRAGKVDLIKFDIEGSEFEVFSSWKDNKTESVMMLVGEVHEDLGRNTLQSFLSLFDEYSSSFKQTGNMRYVVQLSKINN